MLVDTHCHLDFKEFDADRDAVLERARAAGVGRIVDIGSSIEGSRRAVELASRYDIVYASVGVHPHHADTVTKEAFDELKVLARSPKVVAIGEVGLDYYRNLSPKKEQVSTFEKLATLAKESELPLVIHARECHDEALDILRGIYGSDRVNGVMHCFSQDKEFLRKCLEMGLYISFTCNITFKNAKSLRETARSMPVERLLLETDAPYLSPEGMRGKRNEPSSVAFLAEEWSKILSLSKEDIARITTHNANSLFSLGLEDGSKLAYKIRDSLYLNITNRCTNSCDFCIRSKTRFVKGHNLKLDDEPTVEDILKAVGDPKVYKEIVFCGYGEPTLRLDAVKAIAAKLKAMGARIRVVTNGHGDLINKRSIAPELKGLIDSFSVSLNADTRNVYDQFCKPEFGAASYDAVKTFIKSCIASGVGVEVTCLDLPGVDMDKCRKIAADLGASFRARHLGVVG
jgi:TatD DNase family protein